MAHGRQDRLDQRARGEPRLPHAHHVGGDALERHGQLLERAGRSVGLQRPAQALVVVDGLALAGQGDGPGQQLARHQLRAVELAPQALHPGHAGHGRVLGQRRPVDGAHRAAHDQVGPEVPLGQGPQHADLQGPQVAAAGQHEGHRPRPALPASPAGQERHDPASARASARSTAGAPGRRTRRGGSGGRRDPRPRSRPARPGAPTGQLVGGAAWWGRASEPRGPPRPAPAGRRPS